MDLCWSQLLVAIIISSTMAGPVKIVQPFPRNVVKVEGESASVTCVAEGKTDDVQFVRRNHLGAFSQLTNDSRVYMTSKVEGVQTVFTLYFETMMISDDSSERRYECWAHQPGDTTSHWLNSAKHGFSVNVVSKSSLPTISPEKPVIYKKKLGESLRLDCNMTTPKQTFDVRAYSVHWMRNEKIIETVYAENGHFNRTLSPLLLNRISSKDGGNYTCVMETKIRDIKPLNISGGTNIVYVDVQVTKAAQLMYVIERRNVTLECNAEGYPLRVEWKKVIGGLELDFASIPKLFQKSRFYKDCETCHHKVDLHDVTKEFSGKYLCRATNILGSGQQFFTLSVEEQIKIASPFPRNIYIVEGEPATVTCIAGGRPDEVQFVRRNELGKFGKLLNTSRVYTTFRLEKDQTFFTLHFERTVLGDDSAIKRYECWAHQPGDSTKHWHDSAKFGFSVNVIKKNSLPQLSPNTTMVYRKRLGESLTLVCNMTVSKETFDIRAYAVHWLRNDKITKTIYAVNGHFERTLKPLSFNKISSKDGGNYSCVMETKLRGIKPMNITGGTRAVFVHVQMTKGNQAIQAVKGNNVTLECSAEGYPLTVVWKKVIGGLEIDVASIPDISRNARFYQDCEYCHYKLELHNVTKLFGGTYRCRTINSMGSSQQQFTLSVKDSVSSSSVIPTFETAVITFLVVLLKDG